MKTHACIASILFFLSIFMPMKAFCEEVSVSFARGAWDAEEWLMVRSPRWEVTGEWEQNDDCISNRIPAGMTPEEQLSSPETYVSMLYKTPFRQNSVFRTRCAFDYRMAPLLVFSRELVPEHREHLEVVLFDRGLNLWHHYFKDGKPSWKKLGFLETPFSPGVVYDLSAEIFTNEDGTFLTMSCDGKSLTCPIDGGWPNVFYAGITACEGRNRFYDFRVRPFVGAGSEPEDTETTRKAGDRMVKTVDGIEYAFRWCPAGTFTMGDEECYETPHSVTLTKGFWMLETEVTQAMWESVMGENPSWFSTEGIGSEEVSGQETLRFPVEEVSWDDCQSFCRKLSDKLGLTVSLPAEAQWEYACRAGTTTAYSFGSNESDLWRYGNYCDASNTNDFNWQDKAHNDGHDRTAPVASYAPNAWGLYDMHGNVWEWCQDWYDEDYYAESPASDPTGPTSGSLRVDRGGSWSSLAECCRSAFRDYCEPGARSNNLGFRIVLAESDK